MSDEIKTFDFELVEPESMVFEGPMWQVVMPGTTGEFGVRAGHCALVSSLGPGVISFWRTEQESPKKVFVAGGFAHVTGESCTVIVEQAIELKDLDAEQIEGGIRALEDEKSLAASQAERDVVDQKIALERAKLGAVIYHLSPLPASGTAA